MRIDAQKSVLDGGQRDNTTLQSLRCLGSEEPSTTDTVLVLDAHCRYAVTAIRCLGRRGVDIVAASPVRRSAGSLSKYTGEIRQYPSPERETEAFLSWLESELRDGEYRMVLPVAEATVRPVAKARERFEPHTIVPLPPNDRMLACLDKSRTIRAAREANVAHPKTLLDSPSYDRAVETLGRPLVVKAREGSSRSGVYVCDDRSTFEKALETAHTPVGSPLVQEYVPDGGERGVYTVYSCEGALLGLTVQHRLRSSHDDGGASTYRETVDDPEIRQTARRLLEHLEWRGVAMVEFRIDARTGEPKLMEVNPRLWGSLALTVQAGVDVPYLLYRAACFGDAEPTLTYTAGVRMRWLLGDIMRFTKTSDRSRVTREFLADSVSRTGYDVLSFDDPLPFFGSVETMLRDAHARVAGVTGRGSATTN